MTMLEEFERAHRDWFTIAEAVALPTHTWSTPDRQKWTPQMVLQGHQPRLSDRWAWGQLHHWVIRGDVLVAHVDLPTQLLTHNRKDPVRQYIESAKDGDDELGWDVPGIYGTIDMVGEMRGYRVYVEFGACAPIKFVLHLGMSPPQGPGPGGIQRSGLAHHMIVPYGTPYAFVFAPRRQLIDLPGPFPN